MHSKNRKQKAAYWRGEKILLFFKRSVIVLCIFIVIAIVILGVKISARAFPVKNILVYGNSNLHRGEIIEALNIRDGESLFRLSFNELDTRLKNLLWVKRASLKKQFPATLIVKIEEAVPKALLRIGTRLFLIDSDSRILEEIKDKGTYFLPVILEIDPEKDRGGVLESLKLIDALNGKNILPGKSIEIMLRPYGLAMNVDGEFVKVGYGGYVKKLDRWRELEPEIRRKNLIIDYIDLRFEGSVIIKPLKTIKKNPATDTKEKNGSRVQGGKGSRR